MQECLLNKMSYQDVKPATISARQSQITISYLAFSNKNHAVQKEFQFERSID